MCSSPACIFPPHRNEPAHFTTPAHATSPSVCAEPAQRISVQRRLPVTRPEPLIVTAAYSPPLILPLPAMLMFSITNLLPSPARRRPPSAGPPP